MNHDRSSSRLHLVPRARLQPCQLTAYRAYTRALLRRYFRLALDLGRLPSMLGGLCFRARVSSYPLHTFEDSVIFVHDIERVCNALQPPALEVIVGVLLLDYSIPEVARQLGLSTPRAGRRFTTALDTLTRALLDAGLLRPVFGDDRLPIQPAPVPRKPPTSVPLDELPGQQQSATPFRVF